MDVASLQSLPHSESLIRSPAISSTTTSFSFTTSSSSRSSDDGAPPLRSIDATELPRNDYHGAGPTVHHRGADGIDDADGDGVNENRVSGCFSNSVASSHDIPFHTSVRGGAAAQSPIMGESQQQLPQHQHQHRRASLSSLPSCRSRRGSSELVSALSGHAHQPASATAGAAATAAARVLELQRPNSRPHSDRRRRSDNNSSSSSGTSSVHHSKAVSAVSAEALLLTRENSVASSFSASFKGFSPLARPPLPSPTAAASGVGDKARRSDSSVAAFASVLESSQVEAALQVYVGRGGVAVADVTQALSTLPWRTAAPAKEAVVSPFIEASSESSRESLSEGSAAGKEGKKRERRRKKRRASEASPLSMLDPEGWLSVVAQATLAARTASADAGESNKRENEEEEEVGVGEAEGSALGEEMGVPPYRGPTALVFDRYGTFFAAGESGDRVASSSLSSRRLSTTGGVERPVSSMSASAPYHQSQQQQQQHPQHNLNPSRLPSASAGRRLTFDTEDDDDGESGGKEQGRGRGEGASGGGGESVTNRMEGHRPGAEQQQHFQVLQQLSSQQRPPSASLVSFSSQPLLSQPSPRVPTLTRASMPPAASAQHHSRPPRSSGTRTAANSKHTTGTTTTSAAAAAITKLHSSSLPPRSPSSSSLGGSVPLDDALFTRQLPTSTAAPAEEAGMQVLFQLCLCTPLGTSSSTMTEDDWTTLVDALRSDGHRKLPPAPILDHVRRTIAESIQLRGRHVGLNAADFAHILRAELTEVRRDLTSPKPEKMASAAGGAEASRSAEFVRVEFPAHPDYLVAARETAAVAPSAAAQRDTFGGLSWTRSEGGEGKGSWRVLPTWCMALAGMFPAEVSAICPTAVVRYLRSVALVKAVLMALIQRAELEAAAMAEAAAQAATAEKKKGEEGGEQNALQLPSSTRMSADATGDGATSHPPQQQLVLNAVSSSTSHSRPVSAASQRIPSPVGVTDFVWPPRAGSLVSFSFSNAPVLAGAASVGGGRPTSSVVLTSLSREPTDWSQQHHPLPLPGRAAHSGAAVAVLHGGNDGLLYEPAVGNANTSVQDALGAASAAAVAPHGVSSSSSPSGANGKLDFSNGTAAAAAVADLSSSVPSASLSASMRATSSASHRYLQSRPLDEVGASVVARAKARRLLDSLRRSTVPINRYECFARVEQEDEPMQEPLCFVTKAELKRTLGDSDGDASSDSDAMSDLLAELTYDPAEVESMLRSREQEALSSGGAAAAAAGGEGGEGRGGGGGHGGPYVELPQRASSAAYPPRHTVRPVVLPAAPVEKLLTNVFARPVRSSVLARAARVSSAAALTPSKLEGGDTGAGAGGVTLQEAAGGHGRLSSAQPPPLTGAAAVAPPPPPVPGMFRMTGLLLGALPKKQEDALVARLSEPQYDPRKMGLRAASANLARPSAGPRADAVAAKEKAKGQSAGGGKDNRQRQHARQTPEKAQRAAEGDGVRRHNTPRRSPRRTVSPPAGQPCANSGGGDGRTSLSPPYNLHQHHRDDSSNRNRTPQSRRAPAAAPTPPSPSPRHTSATATPGKAVVRSPRLTRSQAAAYACFQPPPALLQAPLSPAAAALAAAQVMNGTSSPYKAAAGGGSAGSGVRAVVRGSQRGVSPRSTPVKPRSRPAAGVSPRPPSPRQQQQQQHPLRANPPDQPYTHNTFMLHAVGSPRQRRPTLPLSPKGKQRRRQPRRRTAAPPASRSNTQRRSTQRPPPSRTEEGKRGSSRSSGAASAAAVERTAKAVVEAEAPAADAAPAAAMSLYERRLLRRLQLSYIAENMTES